ncbi:LOW QUALITY PROTEIN: hypothetical protein CVT26_001475 [Gymnopilus dilepis]|uniref:F-box domain-containing protein n=1 Tax=Gymnopilus dilepis TaxID=231916 RepID=A0A409WBC2_9AGAR|nr:LOW QUALITY PROTEIN: hypothetical protein CVT26_001475 [Gymnopilus dilepis]
MSSLFLANELLDLIVGHLDADSPADRRALLSCALVNNALRMMTRPQVFRRVKISYEPSTKQTVFTDSKFATGAEFLDIITNNPLIAGLVKELVIEVVLLGVSGSIDICSDNEMFSLYRITHQLAKLQKFSIASSSDIFLWEDTEKTTQLFLYEIASRVRSLDVSIFKDFPLSAFLNAKKLRTLRVQNLDWNIVGSRHYTNPKVELESLDIGYGWRFLDMGMKKCQI